LDAVHAQPAVPTARSKGKAIGDTWAAFRSAGPRTTNHSYAAHGLVQTAPMITVINNKVSKRLS